MEYESNILKRLVEKYVVIGNPSYISEIIKQFITRGQKDFPQLFTYQADWLNHIDKFGLSSGEYTMTYTGQSVYIPTTKGEPVKRAILKGSTKYRDIDTGEFLETFEEGRNLELVSVKVPVLTTTGKNLYNKEIHQLTAIMGASRELYYATDYIPVLPNTTYSKSNNTRYELYDINKTLLNGANGSSFTTTSNTHYVRYNVLKTEIDTHQLEQSSTTTTYEPYKTNTLTVNEDVTLRSKGGVYDELNLLNGRLTQRIDENNEVLAQEVVKTVALSIVDQDNQTVNKLSTFDGGTHISSGSDTLIPVFEVEVIEDLEKLILECSSTGNTM